MDFVVWFLLALPLALDVFAAGLVFGVSGLDRARWLPVALGFAAIGAAFIAAGIFLGDALEGAVGTAALYVAGAILLIIGLRGLQHGLQSGNVGDVKVVPPLTTRKIAVTTVAVAVDKLAVGLSFAVLDAPKAMMVGTVAAQALAATLLGLWLGKKLGTRAGDYAEVIAGVVFTVLGLAVFFKAFTSNG